MASDERFEQALQALLDGHGLGPAEAADGAGAATGALHVVDAVARVHRIALFGSELRLDRPVATTWGHLDIRAEIGRGASGTVYRAWDTRLAREVALKLLAQDVSPEAALEEGRHLARLNHPHIVRVFGADTHAGVAGVWMELLDGETLDDVLARDGTFGTEETILIGLDLARALAAVHGAGLLHRDIKARNVLRERGGRVVLMDLGAGRLTGDVPAAGVETGTPMYMAPEVLAGGPASTQSDIYSLGVLLYRMRAGCFPVEAPDFETLRAAHAAGRRTWLTAARLGLHPALVAIVDRCCQAESVARYASASHVEADLTDALRRVVDERFPLRPRVLRMVARRRRALHTAAVAGLLVSLTMGGLWNTTPGRAMRRLVGFPVAPRSPLYIAYGGGLGILRGRTLSVVPNNPGTATVLAVSADLGVRTSVGIPPWIPGAAFALDGTPLPPPTTAGHGVCCFYDGTTDGRFNYAARADSTLLAPIGSRALAPAALYRFDRDWSNPRMVFPLLPEGFYSAIAYDGRSRTFWLARFDSGSSRIERWRSDGTMLSDSVTSFTGFVTGLAVDPLDATVWVVRPGTSPERLQLENLDARGRPLGSFEVPRGDAGPLTASGGAEFAWQPSP
jgi:Protein kinase domain